VDAGTPAEPVQQPVSTPSANDAAQAARPDQSTPQDDDAKLLEALGITADDAAEVAEPAAATNITPEYLASLAERSQYIKSEADVERATIAADNIWRTIDGQLSITDLFEALRSENKPAFDRMMQDAVEYVSQVTGRPVAQNAAETPESKRIAAVESQLLENRQAQENAAFMQRVNGVKEKVFLPAVTKALAGTFLEGENTHVIDRLGKIFSGKEMELISQLERGDTSKLDKALKAFPFQKISCLADQ